MTMMPADIDYLVLEVEQVLNSDIIAMSARCADLSAAIGRDAFAVSGKGSMRTRRFFIGIGILACGWILTAADNDCLSCHGPFDKLIAASSKYVAPSGEKTSPHRYVPHDSKKEADIPKCDNCHTAHSLDPLPSAKSIDLSKVGVKWCYDACHHEKDLTSCKKCHP